MTYQPKVYRNQGGDQITVASGGVFEIESGGYLTEPVVTVSTSVPVPGTSCLAIVSSTASTGVGVYGLTPPVAAGVHVRIACLSSTGAVTVTSTGPTISAVTTALGTVLTFLKRGASADLISGSTAIWYANLGSTNVTCT